MKLGQIAATRVDLFPAEVCDELALLQNRGPLSQRIECGPSSKRSSTPPPSKSSTASTGSRSPPASIGQTYAAQLQSGEAVVVKIQRPDIADVMDRDLAALSLVAEVAQQRTSFGQSVRTGEVLDQFARSLLSELDFQREASAMEEMAVLSVRRATSESRSSTAISAPTGSSSRSGSKG